MLLLIIALATVLILYLNKNKLKKYKKTFFLGICCVAITLALFKGGAALMTFLLSMIVLILSLANKALNIISQLSLLNSFSGRRPGPNQTNHQSVNMTTHEAREILGVEESSSKSEIKKAYHKLMLKNHPDQGGSKYFAAKINQAKDILLDQ
jgi:hypothetical protein